MLPSNDTLTAGFVSVNQQLTEVFSAQTAFVYRLPADTFVHAIQDERLALSAMLSDGALLPSWLAFDPVSGTFSGLAPEGIDRLVVRVVAIDSDGISAETEVTLEFNE